MAAAIQFWLRRRGSLAALSFEAAHTWAGIIKTASQTRPATRGDVAIKEISLIDRAKECRRLRRSLESEVGGRLRLAGLRWYLRYSILRGGQREDTR